MVKFVITEPKLRFLTADHGYESEAGMFEVYVGTDSMAEENGCSDWKNKEKDRFS